MNDAHIKLHVLPFALTGTLPERDLFVNKFTIRAIERLPDEELLPPQAHCRIYLDSNHSAVVMGSPEDILAQIYVESPGTKRSKA